MNYAFLVKKPSPVSNDYLGLNQIFGLKHCKSYAQAKRALYLH